MLRLIMSTPSGSSDLQACSGYDFVWVVLSEPVVQKWLDRISLAVRMSNENAEFAGYECWNYEAHYCHDPSLGFDELFGVRWADRYEDEGWALEPESFKPPTYEEHRTEADRIKLMPTGLWWEALPKYGDIPVETPQLRTSDLHKFLERLRGNHYGR